ncbi:flavodoxin family protein [Clostridium sp. BNL1100]|uniref:flavodoxin family protein n=1 Tax=Clostridium sp. BNL1100 TaxID=755731 RepID=UPI00024A7D07|nr:flavodoxin family protein [Clostridium sp. BNL1100]AEY67085.1 multimeric flavodoxin WrbA [Clostridium sp. BNL1100]
MNIKNNKVNILVINGSPKGINSNTLKITNAFLDGIKVKYQEFAKIETVIVSTSNINHCKGCFCCWTSTPGSCIINDDMTQILSQIINANIIVWSFPLYYYGMPSKVKALLDRNLPLLLPYITNRDDGGSNHPFRYKGNHAEIVLISTCGFYSTINNYEALIKQFDILYGINYTKIICPEGELFSQKQLSKRINEYLLSVKQAGEEYAFNRCFSDETEQKLNTLLCSPKTFVKFADNSWNIKDI